MPLTLSRMVQKPKSAGGLSLAEMAAAPQAQERSQQPRQRSVSPGVDIYGPADVWSAPRSVAPDKVEQPRRRSTLPVAGPFGGPYAAPKEDLLEKTGLSDMARAIKMTATGTGPYNDDARLADEFTKRLGWYGKYGATLGGELPIPPKEGSYYGPADVWTSPGGRFKKPKEELKAEAEEFVGFGPALMPFAGDALVMLIEYGYLMPKAFKAAGMTNQALSQIPKVQAAKDALDKAGGIAKLAKSHPRLAAAARQAANSFGEGFGVGVTRAGIKIGNEEMSPLEFVETMAKEGAQVGALAAAFSLASSADTALYVRGLRRQVVGRINQQYDAQSNFYLKQAQEYAYRQGTAKPPASAHQGIASQKRLALQKADQLIAQHEQALTDLKAGKLYREGQKEYPSVQESAAQINQFLDQGYRSGRFKVTRARPLERGLGKTQTVEQEMGGSPNTRAGEMVESVREFVGRVTTPHAQPIRVPRPTPPEMRQLPKTTKPVVGPVEPPARDLRGAAQMRKQYGPISEAPADLAGAIAQAAEVSQVQTQPGGRNALINKHIAQYQRWDRAENGSAAQRQAADEIYATIGLLNRVDGIGDPVDGRPFVPPEMAKAEPFKRPTTDVGKPKPPEIGTGGVGFTPKIQLPPQEEVTPPTLADMAKASKPAAETPAEQPWDYRVQGNKADSKIYDAEGHAVVRSRANLEGKKGIVTEAAKTQARRVFEKGGIAVKADGTRGPGEPVIASAEETTAENVRKAELGRTTAAQGQLGLEVKPPTPGFVAIKPELGTAVAELVQRAKPAQIPKMAKRLKEIALEQFGDRPELFNHPENYLVEVQEAWDQATKGRPLEAVTPKPAEKGTPFKGKVYRAGDLQPKTSVPPDLRGIYFADHYEMAESYTETEGATASTVEEYEVELKNPATDAIVNQVAEDRGFEIGEVDPVYETDADADELTDELIRRGYDGVVRSTGEIVAFSADAVKPAAKTPAKKAPAATRVRVPYSIRHDFEHFWHSEADVAGESPLVKQWASRVFGSAGKESAPSTGQGFSTTLTPEMHAALTNWANKTLAENGGADDVNSATRRASSILKWLAENKPEKPPENKRQFKGGGAGEAAAGRRTDRPNAYGAVKHSESQPRKTNWHSLNSELPKRESFNPIRDVLEIASPAHVGGRALEAGRLLRARTGEMAHEYTVASEALKQASKAFHWLSQEDAIDFIDRMERGVAQKTLRLDEWAKLIRRLLDQRRDAIQGLGKGQLERYYENYFPHIWKEPGAIQRLVRAIMGKRNLAGPKSFLKKRTIPFFKDGIEKGLEPVSWNPIDLVLLKLHEMDKYLMCQRLLQSGKARGMFRFVNVRTPAAQRPDGWVRVNDNAFTVFLPPEMTMKEAYDGLLVEELMHVAQSLGIDSKRFVHIGKRTAWGYASWPQGTPQQGPHTVRTKYAGPESVLVHEIGHVLGVKYNMYNVLGRRHEGELREVKTGAHKGEMKFRHAQEAVEWRRTIDKEWRAVADARFEGSEATPHYKSYVREAREKEAVLLQAYITAPDRFRKIAPKLYEAFRAFLDKHEELRPLMDLKPSLVLEAGEAKVKVPGLTTLGHWYAPKEAARLINNYLSPGLWNNDNKLIASSYNLTRMAGNTLNMVQLGLSLFHGINITTDTVSSVLGLGLRQLTTRHQRLQGLGNVVTAPLLAPARAVWAGTRIKRAYRQVLDDIPDPRLRELVRSVVAAGGRDRMSPFYYNQSIKALQTALRQIWRDPLLKKLSAAVRLPVEVFGAVIEAFAWPLMGWYVPTMKLGVFGILAQHEMQRAQDKEISNEQLWGRLVSSWDSVDNRMGELIYDNLFWNRTFRDCLMVTFRSTGWNLGSWREFGGIPIDVATTAQRLRAGDKFLSQKMVYGIGSVLTYSLMGAVTMYLLTGKRPQTAKDYFFPQTGRIDKNGRPERLSFPTYAKDWYAYADDATRTIVNKVHPGWGMLTDFCRNEDFFGTEIRDTDDPILKQLQAVALYAARQFRPISVQRLLEMQKTKSDWGKNAAVAITGIQPAPAYITRTPAQKLLGSYLRDRMPQGGKTTEQGERSEYRRTFINRLRRGEPVEQAEAVRVLGASQVKAARKQARLEPFVASFKRLSLSEALNVYTIANDRERYTTQAVLRKKFANAHIRTPEMRDQFQELMKIRPSQPAEQPNAEGQSLAEALSGFLQ